MTKALPARKGRRPNEKPVFAPGDIKAIVIMDERIRRLMPAYNRIQFSTSFEGYLAVRNQYPNASQEELVQHWGQRINADTEAYAAKMAGYWRELHDDLTCAAHFLTLQDVQDENGEPVPRKVGLRPTSDDAMKIITAYEDALADFRSRPRADADGLGVLHGILEWLSHQPPITKTLAFQKWDKVFRYRPARVRRMQEMIAAFYKECRRRGLGSASESLFRLAQRRAEYSAERSTSTYGNSGHELTTFRHDGQPVPLASEYPARSFDYSPPVNTAATAASTAHVPTGTTPVPQNCAPQVSFLGGMRIEKTAKGEWRVFDDRLHRYDKRRVTQK